MGAGASASSAGAVELGAGRFLPLSVEDAEKVRSSLPSGCDRGSVPLGVFCTALQVSLATQVEDEVVADLCSQFIQGEASTVDATAALNFFVAAGAKFLDKAFLPQRSSIGRERANVVWKRAEEVSAEAKLFLGGVPDPGRVKQGSEGDCWLVASAALLAGSPASALRVVPSQPGWLDEGKVCVNIFHDGEWVAVEVDTFLPCWDRGEVDDEEEEEEEEEEEGVEGEEGDDGGAAADAAALIKRKKRSRYVPAFARSIDPSEMWICFLEKAFAKIFGSYHNLQGGNTSEGLRDLTASPVLDFDLEKGAEAAACKDFLAAGFHSHGLREFLEETGGKG